MKPSRTSIFRHVDKSTLRQVPHVSIGIGKVHLIKGRNFTLAKRFNGNFNGLEKRVFKIRESAALGFSALYLKTIIDSIVP